MEESQTFRGCSKISNEIEMTEIFQRENLLGNSLPSLKLVWGRYRLVYSLYPPHAHEDTCSQAQIVHLSFPHLPLFWTRPLQSHYPVSPQFHLHNDAPNAPERPHPLLLLPSWILVTKSNLHGLWLECTEYEFSLHTIGWYLAFNQLVQWWHTNTSCTNIWLILDGKR